MIKYLLTFFFMALCTFTKGQNISLDELISLRTQSLLSVGNFLTAKQWSVTSITEPTKTIFGDMSILYRPNNEDFPVPYINIEVSRKPASNTLAFVFFSTEKYNDYMGSLTNLGYKSILTTETVIIYEANKTVISVELMHSTSDEDKTTYRIVFCDSLTFQNFINKK